MNTIKIHILHCGSVWVDRAVPFYEKTLHPMPYTGFFRGENKKVRLPVSAYLIEHPKGLVLIDTGWHTDVRKDGGREHLGLLHWLINKADLPEGQAVTEQLAKLGYQPSDIDYLVMSHLHTDHASGMQLLKDARKILVSRQEWHETKRRKLTYLPAMWDGLDIEIFDFQKSDYGNERKAFDLFGDDSVVFVNTPGHTLGLAATLVQNNGKFVLLASDVGYAEKSWKEMLLPGVQVDKQKVKASLEWVGMMSQHPDCIKVIANHDPEIKPQIIEL